MAAAAIRHHVALGKLAPPRLGRVFARQRLFALLDGCSELPAQWLAGAPGAGKSTLVATWLRHRAATTLWLHLDAGDGDPATFVQSLDALLKRVASSVLDLPPFSADDDADIAGWLRRRLRLVLRHVEPPWVLVLDNYQELPANSLLHGALAQGLAELPSGVQWVFVSRAPPPAAYARALVQQQLAIVDAEQLRFDDQETLALTRLHGHTDDIAPALAAAQGWAGGLTLMLLGSSPNAPWPSLAARQQLFDYFAGEVLARMPPDEQQALGAMAYLPRATGAQAVAISGLATAPALLDRLAAQSLFTDRREGAPTVYVFHALFSDFLHKRHQAQHAGEALRTLQLRAGQLLAEDGQVDAALRRLIDGAHWPEAQALLLRTAADFIASGRTEALRQCIDGLPAAEQAALRYWRGLSLLDSDPGLALQDIEHAYQGRQAAGDVDGQLEAAAAACTALVSTGRFHDLDRWLAVLDAHAQRAAVRQSEDIEMRWVPGLLAGVVYRAPWHALADGLAERAERLLHRESVPGQHLLLASLAFHLLWRGHVDRLERVVLRIDALCAQPLAAPATLMRWWSVGILVKTLLGQHASALADAERALALVATEPAAGAQRASAELLRMIVALACTDAAAARRHLELAAQALHPDNAVDRSIYEHQRGILALLENDHATALRLMRAAVTSGQAGGYLMREHIALIANALAAACCDEHAEAQWLLAQAFAQPFHAAARWFHWIGHMVAAYAALRRGDEPMALGHLQQALAVARDCGFRHGPMLFCCGDMMARLAALALANGIEAEITRDIVQRNALKAPPEADARWPWALRVHALGTWQIARVDGPLPSGRKESRRLLALLHLLAAQGQTPIAQDTLADTLWPDADGDAARNALDNALHRLRKWLGGDDRIVLRHGALRLNPQRCWTDVRALEVALQQLDNVSLAGLPAALHTVLALYTGPLLPGVPLAPVAARRAALHRSVQQHLLRAAQQLEVAADGQSAVALRAALQALESLPDP